MPKLIPSVDPTAEFLEISNDFTNPKEVVREAISNAFDAGASEIVIRAFIDKTGGEDELVLVIQDNGHGIDETDLHAFFGLGFSTRRNTDEYGRKRSNAIGEKGHGTKIYFNSRRVHLNTVFNGRRIEATLETPRKSLRSGSLPTVTYEINSAAIPSKGTTVTIYGYNNNTPAGFGHNELKDYIYWFTKFGSVELIFGLKERKDVVLRLAGLGWSADEPEPLRFGHYFPEPQHDIRHLKSKDRVSPLDWYVAKWVFPKEELIGIPGSYIDFVFSIEGDQAKRNYNPMLHKKYAAWRSGEYTVEDRYGLWVCKDYFAIDRRSEWVADRSEWTKYHAFVNCQDFRLTANRADLNNTPPIITASVETTVRELFRTRIFPSPEFQKYVKSLNGKNNIAMLNRRNKTFRDGRRLRLPNGLPILITLRFLNRDRRGESSAFSFRLRRCVRSFSILRLWTTTLRSDTTCSLPRILPLI